MIRSPLLPALCIALVSVFLLADAPDDSDSMSALVTLTKLQKGSLPHVVIAYGKVEASSSATQTIMSPLSAIVTSVDVRAGAQVPQGAPLLTMMPGPKTAADYAQAKSALGVANDLVQRTKKMVAAHLATGQQLADAEKSASDARSTLAALQAQGAGGVQTVRAPFAAIVTAVSTTPGAIVSEGASLVELARPGSLVLGVGVTPSQAADIEPGDKVTITRLGEGENFSGAVTSRGSVVDADDGLVNVNVALPPDKFLLGEMAEARITTAKVSGYVVPHAAILVNDSGATYVVQSENMVAKKVVVHVLEAAGDTDVIDGPLDAKAPLVLEGNYQLDDGMKMRVTEASNNKADKAADEKTDP